MEELHKRGFEAREIVPVHIPQKKGDPLLVSRDEHPRPETTLEGLAKLKPAFRKDGTVTECRAFSTARTARRRGLRVARATMLVSK